MSRSLLSLLQLSDPTLPIGGFAHSAGLETYIQQGVVHNMATANSFITGMLSQNLRYNDAAFVSLCYDAAVSGDIATIQALDHQCSAVKLPTEIRQASNKLGARLVKVFHPLCANLLTDQYRTLVATKEAAGHYCIAFGLYSAALQLSKEEALTAFYYNAAVGFVTNCVKLVPLGQTDGQQMLFSLQELIDKLVQETLVPDPDMLGLCCTGFDIRSMQHERLYSRLYMS
jgi:urease accessory protein